MKQEQVCNTCQHRQCKCPYYWQCQVSGIESHYEMDEKAVKSTEKLRHEMQYSSEWALTNGYD